MDVRGTAPSSEIMNGGLIPPSTPQPAASNGGSGFPMPIAALNSPAPFATPSVAPTTTPTHVSLKSAGADKVKCLLPMNIFVQSSK